MSAECSEVLVKIVDHALWLASCFKQKEADAKRPHKKAHPTDDETYVDVPVSDRFTVGRVRILEGDVVIDSKKPHRTF